MPCARLVRHGGAPRLIPLFSLLDATHPANPNLCLTIHVPPQTCSVLSFANRGEVASTYSVAAVQSGAVQVETWSQLVLYKFTPVHTGATRPQLSNQQ